MTEEQRSASVGEPAEPRVETQRDAEEAAGGEPGSDARPTQPGDFEAAARAVDAKHGEGAPSQASDAGHSPRNVRDAAEGPGGVAE